MNNSLIYVYDLKWNLLAHFWAANGYGLKKVGDCIKMHKDRLIHLGLPREIGNVIVKRME